MDKLIPFIAHHWLLVVSAIVILLVLLKLEAKGKAGGFLNPSPEETINLINHEKAVVIDIRGLEAFNAGHIVDAISIPMADLEGQTKKLKKYKNRPIVVVCVAGRRAVKAAQILKQQGFENVQVLAGGMYAWQQASFPTVKA